MLLLLLLLYFAAAVVATAAAAVGAAAAELCHFFTFCSDIGIKGRLLSPLSLKCASNEH